MSWLESITIGDIAIAVGGLTALFVALRPVVRFFKKIHDFLDDWRGEQPRDGVPGRAGVMLRLSNVEHELKPNSGLSMRDSIDRTEAAVTDIKTALDADATALSVAITERKADIAENRAEIAGLRVDLQKHIADHPPREA